jgi:hypothetical protein
VVGFVTSILVGILVLVIPYTIAKRRRPEPRSLTWGEAMVASMWAFFVMFWWYGVIPHQFLSLADNELNWRKDKAWHGPGNILDKLPFSMNYLVLRDILVVGIYAVGLGLLIVLWSKWQARAKTKPTTDVARSTYGRPLVKA